MICNHEGQVLRRFPTMSHELAEQYATKMLQLATQARGSCRDINPKVVNYRDLFLSLAIKALSNTNFNHIYAERIKDNETTN